MALQTQFSLDGLEVGCDEVGRGALAGPVVAAAVCWPAHTTLVGLQDSKQLPRSAREKLFPLIKARALAWAIGSASPAEIDQYNVLEATFLAMHRALNKTLQQCKPARLLIDGNRFKAYLNLMHHCIVKGDQTYCSIAAAAILAKHYRDDYMQRLAKDYPAYGWQHNVGYPTALHRAALRELGATPHHRKSFHPK